MRRSAVLPPWPILRNAQASPRMGPTLDTAIHVIGRLIFGGYFLYNGINHMVNRRMMAGYAAGKGVPVADLAVVASGALIIAGGAAILLGRKPKLGAGLLTTFLLGVSPAMHAFWNEEDPQQRMQEMVNFTKNMALVGATLLIAAHPEPWPWRVSMPSSRSVALVAASR